MVPTPRLADAGVLLKASELTSVTPLRGHIWQSPHPEELGTRCPTELPSTAQSQGSGSTRKGWELHRRGRKRKGISTTYSPTSLRKLQGSPQGKMQTVLPPKDRQAEVDRPAMKLSLVTLPTGIIPTKCWLIALPSRGKLENLSGTATLT